jgi:NADPH:quinone reductase-like Zn-dependent oxidoreductase
MDQLSPVVRTMQAVVLHGAGRAAIETVLRPEPASQQVRVRLQGCGVCASNLAVWAGPDWMQFPTEPGGLGHEGWAIVDAVGDDVVDPAIASPHYPITVMRNMTWPTPAHACGFRDRSTVSRFQANRSVAP